MLCSKLLSFLLIWRPMRKTFSFTLYISRFMLDILSSFGRDEEEEMTSLDFELDSKCEFSLIAANPDYNRSMQCYELWKPVLRAHRLIGMNLHVHTLVHSKFSFYDVHVTSMQV